MYPHSPFDYFPEDPNIFLTPHPFLLIVYNPLNPISANCMCTGVGPSTKT